MSFPDMGESQKRLFVKKEALHSSAPLSNSDPTDGAACAGGGNAALVSGKNGNGAPKPKRSPDGWEEEKASTPNLDGDTDDREGWEKRTPAWKKVRKKRGWKGRKVQRKRSSLIDDYDDGASPEYMPSKKRFDSKPVRRVTQPSNVYTQPDQRVRGSGRSQQTPP